MKRMTIIGICLLAATHAFSQQVVYFDIDPDHEIPKDDAYTLHLAKNPDDVTYGEAGSFVLWNYNPGILLVTYTECEVLMNGSYPAALDAGDKISSTGVWRSANYAVLSDGSNGNWPSEEDKFLAIRFKQSGEWFYGWVRMKLNSDADEALVKDFAFKDDAGQQILAGEQSTVSVKPFMSKETASIRLLNRVLLIDATEGAYFKIIDVNGKTCNTVKLQDSQTRWNIDYLETGVYIILVADEHHQITTKKIFLE